jgi:hypothetical protein
MSSPPSTGPDRAPGTGSGPTPIWRVVRDRSELERRRRKLRIERLIAQHDRPHWPTFHRPAGS